MLEGYTYFGIPTCIILFLTLIAFLLHASKVICIDGSEYKNRWSIFFYFTSLAFLAWCMFVCVFLAAVPVWDPLFVREMQYTAYTSYTIGASFSFTLFLHSLHGSFHNTNHAYPLWLLWSIGIIQWTFIVFLLIFDYYAFWIDFSLFHYHVLMYFPFEFVINFVLLVLFNRVVFLVTKELIIDVNGKSQDKDENVQDLLNIVVRGTVLIGLMTFWGALVLAETSFITNGITFGLGEASFGSLIWTTQYVQCAVMGIAVYFKNRIGSGAYYRVCGWQHTCCMRLSEKMVVALWGHDMENMSQMQSAVKDKSVKEINTQPNNQEVTV